MLARLGWSIFLFINIHLPPTGTGTQLVGRMSSLDAGIQQVFAGQDVGAPLLMQMSVVQMRAFACLGNLISVSPDLRRLNPPGVG